MPRLVKGGDLTPAQREEVLRAFVHRNTVERPDRTLPGMVMVRSSDEEWLQEHAFYITVKGRLAQVPTYCEPHYMADLPAYLAREKEAE
jgi:hypothetical protein